MNNYRFLNLPKNPLRDSNYLSGLTLLALPMRGAQTIHSIDILSNEMLDIFKQKNLSPSFCVVFTLNNKIGIEEDRVLHSDILRVDNIWKKIICGINYELNNTENEFSWWHSDATEQYPLTSEIKTNKLDDIFNGIHYGNSRRVFGIDYSNTRKLEAVELTGPTLVRTDIPHLITYNSPLTIRKALSIRFEETWNSWDEAVEAFTPLLKV